MKKRRKQSDSGITSKLLRRVGMWSVLILAVYVIGILLHGTITDYKPEERIIIEAQKKSVLTVIDADTLDFVIWNVGYGGLGANADFFYHGSGFLVDGGKRVRSPRAEVQANIEGVQRFLRTNLADFYLFQEVDVESKRSYFINQMNAFSAQLPDYESVFAPNLQVARIPAPILQPWKAYGATYSGLLTFSRFSPGENIRYQLPGKARWPDRIFLLDRCVLTTRYKTESEKELVVMNIHNDAYSKDPALKNLQLEYLKNLATAEYEKGNYVVLGGDWNMCPPYFRFDGFMKERSGKYNQLNIDAGLFPEEWNWIYDPTEPTNRKTDTKYEPGKTFVTLIDFYLLSPNMKALQVKTIDQAFAYSDHQPVSLKLVLR